MLTVKIHGTKELAKELDSRFEKIRAAARDALDYALENTVTYMKEEFDKEKTGRGFRDRTGNLRNSESHKIEENPRKVRGVIRAGMPYALAVETRREGRNAFMYPALQEKKEFISKIIKEALEEAMK